MGSNNENDSPLNFLADSITNDKNPSERALVCQEFIFARSLLCVFLVHGHNFYLSSSSSSFSSSIDDEIYFALFWNFI
jgi:hypothetical protein